MENHHFQQQPPPPPPSNATIPSSLPSHHHLEHQQQHLQSFWTYQRREISNSHDFKNHNLPLARIKKIMKADEDVRMISAEAPILFAKACEIFILELTTRSWLHAEENKRRTLQKDDIFAAITRTEILDFLADIVPRDEVKDEVEMGPVVDGLSYYYPPGVTMAGVDPDLYGQAGIMPPPSQAWQSVWQNGDDGSYGSGGGGGGGSVEGGSVDHESLDFQG